MAGCAVPVTRHLSCYVTTWFARLLAKCSRKLSRRLSAVQVAYAVAYKMFK